METSNIQQVNKQQQEQQQQQLDSQTMERIQAKLKELYNKPQYQQQQRQRSSRGGKPFIKLSHDMEAKRLYFTGTFEEEQMPAKDFNTNQIIEGRLLQRFFFECYDITDPDYPSEISVWERGPKDAKTILYWLSNSQRVLDVIRHGQPNDPSTTYDIHPPIK